MKFTKARALFLILTLILALNLGFTSAQEAVDVGKLNYHTPQTIADFENLQAQIIKTVEQVRTSVVCIQIAGGSGSGTFISEDGWVLTAAHVTRWKAEVKCNIVLPDGTKLPAVSKGFNRELDFALVKADIPKDMKVNVSKLGDSDDVKLGRWVISMGHPLGFKTNPVRPPVVRTGRVTRLGRMIVSDAPLISGDSGGPMFNLDGEVLGVNVSISIQNVKINNTTKVNPVKAQMEELKAGKQTSGSGASVSGYDNGIKDAYATLDKATANKDPEGFKKAENEFLEVIKLDDTNPEGYYHLTCCYSRWMNILAGEEKTAMQTKSLDMLTKAFEMGYNNFTHMAGDPDLGNIKQTERYRILVNKYRGGVYFGFSLRDLNDEQKEKYGAKGGVLVTEVHKNEPADKAGIMVNDVVTSIDNFATTDTIKLRNYKPRLKVGQTVKLKVLRLVEEKVETLELTMVLGGVSKASTSSSFSELIYKEGPKLREVWKEVVKDSKLQDSVVRINTTTGKLLSYGVIVSEDGLILTKFSQYAIDSEGKYKLLNYPKTIVELADGRKFAPTQVNESRNLDLALLRIKAEGLKPVKWGDSTNYKIGEFVSAFANKDIPIGIGIISLHNYESNVGPKNIVLGVSIADVDNLKKYGIDYDKGISITRVEPNSNAGKANLRKGDIIVDIDDEGINTSKKLREYLATLEPGRKIWVEVYRPNTEGTFTKIVQLTSAIISSGRVNRRYDAIAGPRNLIAEGFGKVIQHDITLRPEYAGTLLVNLNGEVMGLNISRVERTRSYAIPANVIKEILPKLIDEMRDIPLKEGFEEEKEKLDEEDF